jgi:hypothetical protein
MYVVGSDFGLIPLYLTAYSTDSNCIVDEPAPSMATVAKQFTSNNTTASVEIHDCIGSLPDDLDFVVWGACALDNIFAMLSFDQIFLKIQEEGIMVIAGINASKKNREIWKVFRTHPKVTVAIDLYRLGILFVNPKLHPKTYKSIVL